ncbi:Quinonprotein alcohol dehydrogenase-like superfamily [Amanita muscaria]
MELRELFSDALRFISKFHPVIQQSALHTYHSALSFTPTETMLYKRYHKETIGNICQVQGVPKIWDRFVTRQDHGEEVNRVVFSQDSSMFASLSERYAKFWDTVTGAPIGTIVDEVSAIADDFSIAASYNNSTITLYGVNSCTSLATTNMAPASVIKLAISPDGRRLAVGLSDGTVCLWNWRSVDPVARLDKFVWDQESGHCCLTFNSSGDRLVFGTNGGIVLRNGVSGEFVAEMKQGKSPGCVAFSGNGSRLAHRDECQFSLWDGKNGALLGITELKEPGHLIAVSDDGMLIAVNQGERTVLWSLNSRNCLEAVGSIDTNHHRYRISSITFHHDGLLALVLSVRFWDVSGCFTSVALYDIKDRSFIPMEEGCMTISPDNTWTVMSDLDSILQLMNLEKASLRPIKGREGNSVKDIASLVKSWPCMMYKESLSSPKVPVRLDFSPDCLRLASCYDNGTVDLWDTRSTRQRIATLKTSTPISHCVFSADGSRLASGLSDGVIKLWDGRDGAHIGNLKSKYPNITSIVFLRGILAARSQASGDPSSESDITLWDLKTLRRIVTVTTDSSKLLELFHHDTMLAYYKERRLSEDIDVTVWDAERRAPHATIPMTSIPNSIEEMVMSPDKSKLVMQLDDGHLKSFDLINGCEEVLPSSRREDLDWDWLPPIRSWHGVSVWFHRTENGDYWVSGRSSQDVIPMPLLWIHDPANAHVRYVARGSSMFALVYRSEQGSVPCHNIVVLRSSPTGSFN